MSYAWHQLRCAVKALNRTCSRRERLAGAYSKLIKLKAKDLPAEVVNDFEKLVGSIPRYPAKHIFQHIKTRVETLSDTQVVEAISLIGAVHETLANYQPRRNHPSEAVPRTIVLADLDPSPQAERIALISP